jgi:hypothetical protein
MTKEYLWKKREEKTKEYAWKGARAGHNVDCKRANFRYLGKRYYYSWKLQERGLSSSAVRRSYVLPLSTSSSPTVDERLGVPCFAKHTTAERPFRFSPFGFCFGPNSQRKPDNVGRESASLPQAGLPIGFWCLYHRWDNKRCFQ